MAEEVDLIMADFEALIKVVSFDGMLCGAEEFVKLTKAVVCSNKFGGTKKLSN